MAGVILCNNVAVQLGKPDSGFYLGPIRLELERGLITGLVGRNGAGKTTLIKTLVNQLEPEGGRVLYEGKTFEEDEVNIRRKVRAVLEEVLIAPRTSVEDFVDTIAYFEPWFDREQFKVWMKRFQLPLDLPATEYSADMKKVFSLIFTICRGPEVLLLDEPTSGVDPVTRRQMLEVLQEFMEDENHTILFSTHLTEDLDKIADRVVLIENGKIVLDEEKEQLKARFSGIKGRMPAIDEIMEYVYVQKKEREVWR
ncbi:MAG: ABC transporter ATP-binding protein [Lachnospiraceae bacterium]|nr:ABC transporter ATP-binding protein [Lachnospiraceae bacterium]